MKIGIVGLSGTGSPVAEMLYRLGVGELLFIDNDRIEEKNLSRMLNASIEDVRNNRYKVELLKEAYDKIGLDSNIQSIPQKVQSIEAINALAQCDIVFGCMDTHSGRAFLNRLCTFYLIPYFDIGVKLKADDIGGVSEVCGTIRYLEPDGSSLLSRGAINQEKISAEDMHLENPKLYNQLRREKYIQGVNEESPAVISINTMLSSMAVNDFLARIHPYRNQDNSDIESIAINLCELEFVKSPKSISAAKPLYVGMGDMVPVLDMPSLSELK
ncbi:MAG: ThiF family adenylyltransferase [Spirochaetia bacterium]|jgi:hypothetical protein|nr:ThiF family adenylyltransferase [Spirochaetia bacterium]